MIMIRYIYDVDDDIDDHHVMFGIILFVFLTAILERAMDRRKKNAKTVRPAIHHKGKVHRKKSKKKLTSVSFAFTHTYTLEKLTLLLFSPSVHGKF